VSDGLTPKQLEALAAVDHYYEALGEPAPASYVARKLGVTHERARFYFRALSDLGWLKGPTSPALPARRLPGLAGGLEEIQLGKAVARTDSLAMASRRQPPNRLPERTPTSGPRTVDLPPLCLRADVEPDSVDEEDRSVDVVFTTGAAVERMDWWTGKRYFETLSTDPAHVRLARLNAGGPLLDTHGSYSVRDQLGSVIPGSALVTGKEGRARVRFSRREAVEDVWQDVRDGHIRSVSVGYRVYKFEESQGKGNALPERRAVDWEPFEVSMVSMPADTGAQVRDGDTAQANRCEIVPAPAPAAAKAEEKVMHEDTRSETLVERNPLAPPPAPEAPPEPTERDQGAEAERKRVQGILLAVRAGRLPHSFADRLIAEKVPLDDAQSQVLREIDKRNTDVPRQSPSGGPVVFLVDDPFVHVRAGIENALLHRVRPKTAGDPKGFELTDVGRPYRGMTMLRIAEAYLNQRGGRTTGLSKMELAAEALGLSSRTPGMHTTSDFATLLADVANKTLRRAYEEAPQTWAPISRRTTLPDFKPVRRLQIGEAPALLEVGEHGEFTFGTIGEGKEQFALATYGRRFAITRKALVNDDTDAFSRVPTLFGRAARSLESDVVWEQLTSNPVMGDGKTLFHVDHNNLSPTSDPISVASIGAGRAAMRVQKGVDGTTLLNIFPQYLVVPAAKETIADQFVSTNLMAAQTSSVNPFAGRLQVVAEPRLDADSVTAWYLVASPDQIDIIEYAYLEGEEGPMVESRVGWEIDGLEVKCREDFAAKVIDWRGLWKNLGA
jgi:prohead serine protease/Mu-like prophage major head subunit gpT